MAHFSHHLFAKLLDRFVVVAVGFQLLADPARNLSATGIREARQLTVVGNGHDTRDDRDIDAHVTDTVNEVEVAVCVEEVLSDRAVCTGFHFVDEAAPPKMDPVPMPELACEKVEDTYILRDGASGLFLAASKFPKNRETRAPLVNEILPHKKEIDPKYNFLFSAPTEDDDGNPSVIRYSRKTKEQYVQTEIEGKATGWKAFYQGGAWVVQDKPVKKAAAKKAPAKKKPAKKKATAKKAKATDEG